MSDDHDERPTPDLGYPAQIEPARQRVRTPAAGVPIYIPPELSRRRRSDSEIDNGDSAATDVLTAVVSSEVERFARRKLRRLRGAVWAALVASGGAILAVFGRMLDAREADGIGKQRLEYLERELMILRTSRDGRRADDQPTLPSWLRFVPSTGASPVVTDQASRPAAQPQNPATRGP